MPLSWLDTTSLMDSAVLDLSLASLRLVLSIVNLLALYFLLYLVFTQQRKVRDSEAYFGQRDPLTNLRETGALVEEARFLVHQAHSLDGKIRSLVGGACALVCGACSLVCQARPVDTNKCASDGEAFRTFKATDFAAPDTDMKMAINCEKLLVTLEEILSRDIFRAETGENKGNSAGSPPQYSAPAPAETIVRVASECAKFIASSSISPEKWDDDSVYDPDEWEAAEPAEEAGTELWNPESDDHPYTCYGCLEKLASDDSKKSCPVDGCGKHLCDGCLHQIRYWLECFKIAAVFCSCGLTWDRRCTDTMHEYFQKILDNVRTKHRKMPICFKTEVDGGIVDIVAYEMNFQNDAACLTTIPLAYRLTISEPSAATISSPATGLSAIPNSDPEPNDPFPKAVNPLNAAIFGLDAEHDPSTQSIVYKPRNYDNQQLISETDPTPKEVQDESTLPLNTSTPTTPARCKGTALNGISVER